MSHFGLMDKASSWRPLATNDSRKVRGMRVVAVGFAAFVCAVLVVAACQAGRGHSGLHDASSSASHSLSSSHSHHTPPSCAQLPPLAPPLSPRVDATRALSLLSAAIQINTESFDALPQGRTEDDVMAPFLRFHAWLEGAFPRIHASLKRTVVEKYSLLFEWEGIHPERDPLLLMAHIDVVPVLPETASEWTHEPYSGFVDLENGRVWGRGASDAKSVLIGIMCAIEDLLEVGHVPERTVYLSFGCDEESEGKGAFAIAQHLENELHLAGKIGLIVDEGAGFLSMAGINLAAIGVSEKGYTDVQITVETKGGHSSIPPKHTAIGLSALLITALESNPFPPHLSLNNPIIGTAACISHHSPTPYPHLEDLISRWPQSRDELLRVLVAMLSREEVVDLLQTTMAVDVILGGLKINALPERVVTLVNHRIGAHDSVAGVELFYRRVVQDVFREMRVNVTVLDFKDPTRVVWESGGGVGGDGEEVMGKVTVQSLSPFAVLEPSPVSPYNTAQDRGWAVLEGTLHHVYDDEFGPRGVVVGPVFVGGNTDTKSFWRLAKSIYRFSPAEAGGLHTVDEWVSVRGFLKGVDFYEALVLNWGQEKIK
ncbi:hypothetical protein HDU98_004538 [Podochytrium sp. JEL0797]|nr:hypothetical protein HDU98_004538 [Podochytrium sp. JEL0797]